MGRDQQNHSVTAQKSSGLLQSSIVVGSMTMMSRILGLVRDIVLANLIGASGAADAFWMAFKIPNFLRRLFAEGAFSQAFVPVLAEYREKNSRAAVQLLINRVAGTMGGTLLLVTALAIVGAPVLAALFAPGFYAADDPFRFNLVTDLIRITFPYLMLISLTGLCGSVLNSYGHFAVPAFTPVLLNISLIVAAVAVSPYFEVPSYALAWGVLAAGMMQLTFQLPFMARIQMLPKPEWRPKDEGVRKILLLMAPAIFGVSVSQINLLLDTVIASFLQEGSLSWLYYSDRLVELPLGVFAIAVSTVILPSLSRQQAADSLDRFKGTLDWAIRIVVLVGLPATLALMVLAKPILTTLFQHGALTRVDVDMAAMSLQAYAVGLLAFMLIKVLAPGYFSRQDMKTPVKIGIVAMAINMVLNILFVVPLDHFWQIGHMGLALATSIAAVCNAVLLYRGLLLGGVFTASPQLVTTIGRVLMASVVMAFFLYQLTPAQDLWISWSWMLRSWNLLWLCTGGVLTYFAVLFVAGARPRHFRSNLQERS